MSVKTIFLHIVQNISMITKELKEPGLLPAPSWLLGLAYLVSSEEINGS
jgi:hypothetical protein